MLKIGNVPLGLHPVIVLTVTDREAPGKIAQAKKLGVQILEVRIDRFRRLDEKSLLTRVRSLGRLRLPLIATVRSRKEGGGKGISEARRLEIFRKVLPTVRALDLELRSAGLVKRLVPLAHRAGKRVVLSYHNFKSVPPDAFLDRLIEQGKRNGADLVKIAVTPKKNREVIRLLRFTQRHRDRKIVVIGMGKRGQSTRILAPLLGSLLTYTFIGRPQAPGQISLQCLLKKFRVIAENPTRRAEILRQNRGQVLDQKAQGPVPYFFKL